MLNRPAIAALNHLLVQNSWATRRLARFAGKTVRFDIAPLAFACTVLPDGTLLGADLTVSADTTCTIAPSLLPRLALRDATAYAEIRHEGDSALFDEIVALMRELRWDMAEDLSRVTGDIAAERITQAVQTTHRTVRDAALNLSQAAAEYWTEERPLIAKSTDLAKFSGEVEKLRIEVEQLEQRIVRLLGK